MFVMRLKLKEKNFLGQGMIEYILLITLVIVTLLIVFSKKGFVSARIRNSLDTVACGVENKLSGSCSQVCGDARCTGTEDKYSCCEDCGGC